MNVLSLFDGMSCGQIALERAGVKFDNYYASEIDKYAIQICQKNYPNTIQLGDVKDIKADALPKIDLLIGGSPCQGFSFAGKLLNFEDPRSKLFFEFVRLKNELNPKYFLLENVKMKKEYQDVISEYLGVEPIKINSALVSGQNRVRLYWTNIPNIKQPQDKNILLEDILENGIVDRNKSYCIDANYAKGATLEQYLIKSRRQVVFTNCTRDRLNLIRNVFIENYKSNNIKDVLSTEYDFRKLTPIECERLQTVPDNYTKDVSNNQRYKMLGNGWTVDIITDIFKNINF